MVHLKTGVSNKVWRWDDNEMKIGRGILTVNPPGYIVSGNCTKSEDGPWDVEVGRQGKDAAE